MVLIFALFSTTFGISFICWIDDKKSHLKRVLYARELQISDFYVFQGNAATYLRSGGQPNIVLLEIYCCLQQWKNFGNLSRIDKVIAMVRVAPFFDSRCILMSKAYRQWNTGKIMSLDNSVSVLFRPWYKVPVLSHQKLRHFYRASYAKRGLGSRNSVRQLSVRPSVCLSVTRVLCG